MWYIFTMLFMFGGNEITKVYQIPFYLEHDCKAAIHNFINKVPQHPDVYAEKQFCVFIKDIRDS